MKTAIPDVEAWIEWALALAEPIDPDQLFALRAEVDAGNVTPTDMERRYLATCAAFLHLILGHAEKQAMADMLLRALQSGEVTATVIGIEPADKKPEKPH